MEYPGQNIVFESPSENSKVLAFKFSSEDSSGAFSEILESSEEKTPFEWSSENSEDYEFSEFSGEVSYTEFPAKFPPNGNKISKKNVIEVWTRMQRQKGGICYDLLKLKAKQRFNTLSEKESKSFTRLSHAEKQLEKKAPTEYYSIAFHVQEYFYRQQRLVRAKERKIDFIWSSLRYFDSRNNPDIDIEFYQDRAIKKW